MTTPSRIRLIPALTARVTLCQRSAHTEHAGWLIDWLPDDDTEEATVVRALHGLRNSAPQAVHHQPHGAWWVSDRAIGRLAAAWPSLAAALAQVTGQEEEESNQ